MQLKISSSKKIILYKLLKNILIIFLITWSVALLIEGILLKFVFSQIDFLKLTLITFSTIIFIQFLTRKFELTKAYPERKIKIASVFLIIYFILISTLAILNFKSFPILVIITTTLFILFYFYKILLIEE